MPHTPVPGPVPPVHAPGRALRSPVGLSYAVIALLGVVIVADLLMVAASVDMRSFLNGAASGSAGFDEDEANRADYAMAGSGGLYVAALPAVATLFIIWFHRVRWNAEVFAPDTQRRTPGWAIGAWFIPIANLWIPRGIAADVLRASRTDPYGGAPVGRGLLNAWWGAWVWAVVFDRYASRMYDRAQGADAIHYAAGLMTAGAGFDLLAAVLAVLFVRRLTAMQHAKALAVRTVPPG
ncbi:hypothetical protein DDQ41_21535 [Streptomyces spongiicola]|uniref:DUF4328 domain-containing protein n=1 Tax=Streptomyces spongiicola TaxID=1690221 RepID=A0ABM6VAW3_9ACTN|nr:DUF4328 domain-containing protein [Streptomyces spongiicola]AWK11063.1 hypothetical protein DDQ41_21535 [Streptomyces spongiicola]